MIDQRYLEPGVLQFEEVTKIPLIQRNNDPDRCSVCGNFFSFDYGRGLKYCRTLDCWMKNLRLKN